MTAVAAFRNNRGRLPLSLVTSLIIGAASACPVLASLPEHSQPPSRLLLSGAVLRYDEISQELSKEQWLQIMDEIAALGIKTLVIQYHHFSRPARNGQPASELDFMPNETKEAVSSTLSSNSSSNSSSNFSVTAGGTRRHADATGIILDYADAHHINVYMGLWMDQSWYSSLDVMDQLAHNLNRSKADMAQLESELTAKTAGLERSPAEIKDAEAELAVLKRGLVTVQQELEEKAQFFAVDKKGELASHCTATADKLVRLYGKHPSFIGWYLPEEIWDAAFSSETIAVLNPFLKYVRHHCDEVSAPIKRPFAMSPYASRLHYDTVEQIVAAQTELLKATGIDVLMLQDSVGDLNLKEDDDIAVRLKKHFTAFREVASSLKIKLWAELETFEQIGRVRKPASIGRFRKQIEYTFPYLDKGNPMFIAFDYLHFFSLTEAKFPEAKLRSKLYDDYKRDFVDGNVPSSPEKKVEEK